MGRCVLKVLEERRGVRGSERLYVRSLRRKVIGAGWRNKSSCRNVLGVDGFTKGRIRKRGQDGNGGSGGDDSLNPKKKKKEKGRPTTTTTLYFYFLIHLSELVSSIGKPFQRFYERSK